MSGSDKIKICYVTHLPNLTGANQSLLDLIDSLDRKYFHPYVILGKNGPLVEELNRRNICYKVFYYSSDISEKQFYKNIIKKLKSQIALNKIMEFLIAEKIDIVHNNTLLSWVGMEAAKRCGIPYICHVRELVWEDHKIILLHEKRQYDLMKEAVKSIFISKFVESKFVSMYGLNNFTTIMDGFHVERYYADHKPILQSKTVKLLLAGRIAPGKGQLEAIKAVEQLNKNDSYLFELSIVGSIGDWNYYRELKKYVEEHSLENIKFIDFTDLKKLRSECDIALICSCAEALGRVTVESMLSGCLVIGANAGATLEIIEDKKTGLLYKSGDSCDLAKKILFACENAPLMNEISNRARKWAKDNFDHKKYSESISYIYGVSI